MPPRPRATLAGLALGAALLALAGAALSADSSPGRAAAQAWHGVFGDRPQPASAPKRQVVVVLAAPSLADRAAAAVKAPTPARERRWNAEAEGAQRLLLEGLRRRGVRVSRDQVYTRTLNGFSASVGPRALAELERSPFVAGVYPVRTVYPAAALGADPGEGGDASSEVALPGFDGSGVTVALLDGGVDRAHPALPGVRRGFDLVSGGRNVAPAPDPDRPSLLETHGTRIAGLLAQVAPGAHVLPIRVLSWEATADGGHALLGRGDALLAGLERSVDPDADGDTEDAAAIAVAPVVEPYAAFADSPEARAVAGAASLGTLVVAPAGNDGRPGTGFGSIGAPGAASEALTVGALDTRRQVLQAAVELRVGDETILAEPARLLGRVYASAATLGVGALLGPTLGRPDRPGGEQADGSELADFFGRDGRSLVAGRAALLPAGPALGDRVRNAKTAGAAAVLVAGTDLPAGALDLEAGAAVPVLALPAEAGLALLQGLAGGSSATLSLGASTASGNPTLGGVSAFSSGGLAFDGRVKPDVVAPGVGLSTSDPGGLPATTTGTSAAAAVAAGAAALVAQARPGLGALELKGLLVGSAAELARGSEALAVTAQGAGMIDPRRAVAAELAVEPATLAFGRADGPAWTEARSLTVHNVSSRPLTVSFGVAPDHAGQPLEFSAQPSNLTLAPGASADVVLGVRATGELGAAAGGALVVSAAGAQPVRVPWAVTRRAAGGGALVGEVELSHREFAPSPTAPVVLAFRAGRVDGTAEGETIEPVGLLEVELWTAEGKNLGVLARLRDVLPGRYAFGLTGRGPRGGSLPDGTYTLRVRAYPVDADDGARPSTAQAQFTIRR
jgi:subtilisin family serine protease